MVAGVYCAHGNQANSKLAFCPRHHISFRVKFEDERPVQQAARMLGLEVEAENPLVLIQ